MYIFDGLLKFHLILTYCGKGLCLYCFNGLTKFLYFNLNMFEFNFLFENKKNYKDIHS